MKRYILVKEYPGSPRKGVIVYHPHKERGYEDKYKMRNLGNYKNYIFYSEHYIEDYPEFWKKL